MKHRSTLWLVGCLVLVTGACASPEATRRRGGGPGADIGNRPRAVRMHAGSDPYWKTPDRISVEHVPLTAARQAQRADVGHGQ